MIITHQVTDNRRETSGNRTILVLTTSYPSTEEDHSGVFVAKLLAAIKKRGYSIKVVAPSNGVVHGRRDVDGIETIRFGYFWPRSMERLTASAGGIPENMARSMLAKFQLLPMMVTFLITCISEMRKADLIYANWLGAGMIGAVVNSLTHKPLFVSFRGDDGYLARDRLLWRILTRWVIRRSTAILPVSGELGDIILGLGAPHEKCYVPKFGVDTRMFHPAPVSKTRRDKVRVIFVGSLIERKGLRDLLEALAQPGLQNAWLTVVGDGPTAPELKAMSERLGIINRIQWKGSKSPVEVAELMRNSDILCLPSYMEGRPNVVNEAMASGIPVISTRTGGIPDMLVEGKTAFLIEPGDVPKLAHYLRILVSDCDLRWRMGQAGYDFIRESGTSWDVTAEQFDILFRKSLDPTKTDGDD
jgi:glycosyltransferase involved in cell wall biosynthesis